MPYISTIIDNSILEFLATYEEDIFNDPYSLKQLQELNDSEYCKFALLKEKESIIGYIIYYQVLDYITICKIAITKENRGKGYSKLLMDYLFDQCKIYDIATIDLEVRVSNLVAIKLYQSYGFIINRTRKNYYVDNNEDAYDMYKKLKEESYKKINVQ